MKKTQDLEAFELAIYYLFVILTFGGLYVYKVMVKKALSEMR